MPFRRTAAFTLLEMLVASTVLALLVGVIFQLLAAASGSSETTDKRLDADTHARRVFERMAQDFSRMVNDIHEVRHVVEVHVYPVTTEGSAPGWERGQGLQTMVLDRADLFVLRQVRVVSEEGDV